jgi:4-hydroxybenzoate polyprenyltransferase
VGFAAGASSTTDFIGPDFWLWTGLFLLPANLILYGLNDLADRDTDRNNPKKGAHEHLLAPSEETLVKGGVLVMLAVLCLFLAAAPVNAARTYLLAFLALGAAYSLPPLRLKARPFVDSASNVLYALPAGAGFALAAGHSPGWQPFLAAACWTAAMHLLSAIPDIGADQAAGVTTSATVLGREGALAMCLGLWSVAAAICWVVAGPLVGLGACVYPAIAILLLASPARTERAYWLFPRINAALGFVLFLLAGPLGASNGR